MTISRAYSSNSNCTRAAKVALGLGAKPGVHFTVTKGEVGHHWEAIEGAPPIPVVAVPTVEAKGEENVGAPAAPAKATKAPRVRAKAKAKVTAKRPTKRPAAKTARKRSDGTIGHQPGCQRLLDLCRRPAGVSVKEAMSRLKLVSHSVRGLISRLRKEYKFDEERVNGRKVFSNPRPRTKSVAQAEQMAAEHAAQ